MCGRPCRWQRKGAVWRRRGERAKLRADLKTALAARRKDAKLAVEAADALAAALAGFQERDRAVVGLAATLGGATRSALPALADCLFARLQVLHGRGLPWVRDTERADKLLAALLDAKPV